VEDLKMNKVTQKILMMLGLGLTTSALTCGDFKPLDERLSTSEVSVKHTQRVVSGRCNNGTYTTDIGVYKLEFPNGESGSLILRRCGETGSHYHDKDVEIELPIEYKTTVVRDCCGSIIDRRVIGQDSVVLKEYRSSLIPEDILVPHVQRLLSRANDYVGSEQYHRDIREALSEKGFKSGHCLRTVIHKEQINHRNSF